MQRGAILLCGGKSSRMGRDKASLPFGPELMLQRIARILNQSIDWHRMVVVAAIGQEIPALPEPVIVVRDSRPERGPLEGIAAGLRALPAEVAAAYVTSCDVPLLRKEFVEYLFARLENYQIVVPVDGQFYHPLSAVYRPSVLEMVDELLLSDQLRPRQLIDRAKSIRVGLDELRTVDPELVSLMNLNRPEDYEQALKSAAP